MSQAALVIDTDHVKRKPGRPRALSDSVIPKVISLYRSGLGYRAIARELAKEGLWADWSTVRRAIKAHEGETNENISPGDF
jgi:hypothetical protein